MYIVHESTYFGNIQKISMIWWWNENIGWI